MSRTSEIAIEMEDDPVPIVKIIAAQFRRSSRHPEFARAASRFNGTFALASTTDPQSVTVQGSNGRLMVRHGVTDDAKLVVRLDFNKPDEKPTIDGLWRHPLLALSVSKLMESYDKNWTDCANQFWERASRVPGMPRAIRLRCSDENRELVLGEGEPQVLLVGTANQLASLLGGSTVFVLAAMDGQIKIDGSFEHLAILSEVTKDMMLGEL